MYSAFDHWAYWSQMLTVISMFLPCTQWVFGPLSPVTYFDMAREVRGESVSGGRRCGCRKRVWQGHCHEQPSLDHTRGGGHSSSRAQTNPRWSLAHLVRSGRPWEAGVWARDRDQGLEVKRLPVEPIVVPRHDSEREASGSGSDVPLRRWVPHDPAVSEVADPQPWVRRWLS